MDSGIYVILNIKTEKVYVGSAKSFTRRWKRHLKDLRSGKHSSIKLQRSYDKHGETCFVFEIVEYLEYEKTQIIERENFWMTALDSKVSGYNIASASFGDVISNHPRRSEIIAKMKKTISDRYAAMSSLEKQTKYGRPGISNGMYGRQHSDSAKMAMSNANVGHQRNKGWLMGIEQKQTLSELAKLRTGSKNSFFGKVHTETTKQILKDVMVGNTWVTGKSPKEIPYTKEYLLHFPDGSTKRFHGLKAVSREIGISIAAVHGLVKRGGKSRNGFRIEQIKD